MVVDLASTHRECPLWFLKLTINPTTRTSPKIRTGQTYLPAHRPGTDHPARLRVTPLGRRSRRNPRGNVRSDE